MSAGYTRGRVIPGATPLTALAIDAYGDTLVAARYGDDSITLFDTRSGTPRLMVTDIVEPMAIATRGTRAYIRSVGVANDEVVAFDIDAERIVATYPVGFEVTDLTVDPDGHQVYAARTGDAGASVAFIDTSTGRHTTLPLGGAIAGRVRVSADGTRLYVATDGDGGARLVVIDPRRRTVLHSIDIAATVRDAALSMDGTRAFVGSCDARAGAVIDVVDTRRATIVATHKVDLDGLTRMSVSRDGERAYLVGDNQVAIWSLDAGEVTDGISVQAGPSAVVESPDGGRLYIADYAGTITEFDTPAPGASMADEWAAHYGWDHADALMREPSLV